MKGLKIGALAMSIFAVVNGHSQEARELENNGGEKMFSKMDTNSDGNVSKIEFEKFKEGKTNKNGEPFDASKRFEKLDSNSDGNITALEFKTAKENKSSHPKAPRDDSRFIDKMDSDKNSLIDLSEFKSYHASKDHEKQNVDFDKRFKKMDLNNDGNIDEAEVKKVAEMRKERKATQPTK